MRRWLAFVLLLLSCRTSTTAMPAPAPAWEIPFELKDGLAVVNVNGKGLRLDTVATQTTTTDGTAFDIGEQHFTPKKEKEDVLSLGSLPTSSAVVIDFPRRRIYGLQGSMTAWMRWLDERSPKGKLESLPRVAPMTVKAQVGDRLDVFTQLASGTKTTVFPSSLFDSKLISNGVVSGLELKFGDLKFGPMSVQATDELSSEGRLGMDVLQNVVLLIPGNTNQGVWVLVPRE